MYLAATARTIDNGQHSLKLIVPEKRKINKKKLNHENDLSYFEFHECDTIHSYDLATFTLYMEITTEEHRINRKK